MCYGIIYKIENKINGKIYIGQTTTSFDERYGGDVERNTHNKHLQNSIKKYGIENFDIDKCVCKCDTKEELDRVEQFYIYVYNTMDQKNGYNKREGGNGGKLSEETKKKQSKALKGKYCGEKSSMYGKNSEDYMTPEAIQMRRKKISKALKGKYCGEKNHMWGKNPEDYMTPEAIQMRRKKISKALSGEKNPMWGKHLSDEHKQKISESIKKAHENPEYKKKLSEAKKGTNNCRARAVIQLDKNGNFIKAWDYIKQAYQHGFKGDISSCCKGKIKSAGGYIWIYLEDYLDLLQYAF